MKEELLDEQIDADTLAGAWGDLREALMELLDCELFKVGGITVKTGDVTSAWVESYVWLGICSICGMAIALLWVFLDPPLVGKALIFAFFVLFAFTVGPKVAKR